MSRTANQFACFNIELKNAVKGNTAINSPSEPTTARKPFFK
jgi:hypothetical protein